MQIKHLTKFHIINPVINSLFWFCLGGFLGFFFFSSFLYIYYQKIYSDKVLPGIFIHNFKVEGLTVEQIQNYYMEKNKQLKKVSIEFELEHKKSTVSATDLQLGYDEKLIAQQAYSLGRSDNIFTNMSILFEALTNGIVLPASYRFSEEKLNKMLQPFRTEFEREPVNALFTLEQGKVVTFIPSIDGIKIDTEKLINELTQAIPTIILKKPSRYKIYISTKTVKPDITTDEVNNLGIKELIGVGTSLFKGSIPNRVYNIQLAASKLHGVIVKPGEVFSFNKTIGDVSSLTGYKQAYVIQNGRTILGDGGGVCQVSTTFFRALLNAGLPIIERHPHAYRVHYYEEDSPPGIDAAIYTPNIDLKFKNDTNHYILIQTRFEPENSQLTFELYGTKDGREVILNPPVILSTTAPPEPLYQDDPNLPKGEVKQIDWSAPGAKVYFTRIVKKDGKVIYNDRFDSNYRPWQAVFLRGTKEN